MMSNYEILDTCRKHNDPAEIITLPLRLYPVLSRDNIFENIISARSVSRKVPA